MSNTERDELAHVIAGELPGRDGFPKIQDAWLADAILSSRWLASRDRRMKAEAAHKALLDAASDYRLHAHVTTPAIARWLRARAGEIREENN